MSQTAVEDRLEIKGYPKQIEFIRNSSFGCAFVAGAGAGKTHAGALKSLDYLLKNQGAYLLVTAPSYRILEDSTMPKYEEVFPENLVVSKRGLPKPEWRMVSGSKILFWSTDKPEKLVGFEVAAAHMDEASISPFLSYKNILKRLRQRKPNTDEFYPLQIWVTTTPKQLNWLYKEFGVADAPPQNHIIQASTRDNKYIGDIEAYISQLRLEGGEALQDIEGQFLSLAGDCLFSADSLDMQITYCTDPIEEYGDIGNIGQVTIWKDYIPGVRYIAGADCSDEGGEGINCMIIMDAQTGEEVAEVYGDTSSERFAQLIFEVGEKYNFPLLAPERNATAGGLVVGALKAMGYKHLYKDARDKVGWYTTPAANPPKVDRYTMLVEYKNAITNRQTIVRNSEAIGEMSTFVRNKDGKFKHREGYRDDRVMARAICWQMRKHKTGGSLLSFIGGRRPMTTY